VDSWRNPGTCPPKAKGNRAIAPERLENTAGWGCRGRGAALGGCAWRPAAAGHRVTAYEIRVRQV